MKYTQNNLLKIRKKFLVLAESSEFYRMALSEQPE